jgi:hypothetical protein
LNSQTHFTTPFGKGAFRESASTLDPRAGLAPEAFDQFRTALITASWRLNNSQLSVLSLDLQDELNSRAGARWVNHLDIRV